MPRPVPPSASTERPTRPAPAVIECDVRPAPPKPIHVAVALGGTDLGKSGIGTYVRELLPALAAQLQAESSRMTVFGHATELSAFAAAIGTTPQRRVRFVPAKPGPNALWYLARSTVLAEKLGADVLLLPAANRRIAAFGRIPTVAVVHDLAQLHVARKYDRLRMAYFNHVLLRAFRRATRVVAISRATADDLERTIGLSSDRLRIVYNGVNTAQFAGLAPDAPAVRAARAAAGLDAKPYLFYPARLEHPGKNHVRLLRAFAASGLAQSHTLALSGADWGAGELIRATIAELGLGDAVKILGFLPAGDMPALIAGADAVLMLGLREGFGLPALESLCAGRPVCVAQTGALPEVVGDLGVQCDPLDEASIAAALRAVIQDAALRDRCATGGPTWAERFTWTRTAQGLISACREAAFGDA
jgi:glycosyltransferase involved in cell wall biosynthesis